MDPLEGADTVEIVRESDVQVDFQTTMLDPGERAEIVFAPPELMFCPSLKIRMEPTVTSRVSVSVISGNFEIFASPSSILAYEDGVAINENVDADHPLKVVLTSTARQRVRISASLSVTEKTGKYSIVKLSDESEK